MSGLEIQQKRKLHLFRWFMMLVALVILGMYLYFGIRWYRTGESSPVPLPFAAANAAVDESRIPRDTVNVHKVAANEPRYLIIDDYLIKSRIKKADLDSRKMFTMPNNLDDTMWYEKSALPGSGAGAVVISGRNMGISRDGTFSVLAKLAKQDVIKIERGDGKVISYEVRSVEEKSLEWVNQTGMTMMMGSLDATKEGLSLITDSGKWIPSQKEFDSRIIVRAVAR